MSLRLIVFFGGLMCLNLPGSAAPAPVPVVDSAEGQRAFADLAAIYAEGAYPTFNAPQELDDLNSRDPAKATKAGDYILALFEQSWADETNGRASWQALPFWGGGSANPARNYRGSLAEAFGKSESSPAALPSAIWLIQNEQVEDNITAGAQVLSRIHGAQGDTAIDSILKKGHPSQAVLVMALHEAAVRHLIHDKAEIVDFEQSYRVGVRAAAQAAARALGAPVQEYHPDGPLPPIFLKFLKTNAERLLTPVPEHAIWQDVQGEYDPSPGWLLKKTDSSASLLDWFARNENLSTRDYQFHPGSLGQAADQLVAKRKEITILQTSVDTNGDVAQELWEKLGKLSRRNTLTSQFEPHFISLPEITVAIWSWQRGDSDHSQRLLEACFSGAEDDRWLDPAARDYFGNIYHQQMIEQFCDEENDAATLRLAGHLSKPIFDGYFYQDRAKEIVAQLERSEKERNISLPPLPIWWILQVFLSRDQQIIYLANRLRLLHTAQDMQPGDVYYDAVMPYSLSAIYCINPYLELKRLQLVPRDFVLLAPFAADQDYMRTYSFFRNFHPSRTLHRVSWAIAQLANQAAEPSSPQPQTWQSALFQALQGSEGATRAADGILSRGEDGSVYFTSKPKGNVVEELRSWALAQPPRGFWATWLQTPTAFLISYLVFLRYRYLLAHPKPPRRSLLFRWRKKGRS